MSNNTLSSKAMLVRLAVSQWSVRKYDKKISAKVAADYKTTTDMGRYTKVLLAENSIKKISQIANELRSYHYKNTLPWYDWGPRMLPAALYLEYTQKVQFYKTEFEKAVNEFVQNYSTYVTEAQNNLNGMFNPTDYPAPESIASYYSFAVSVNPLPDASDFRVTLSDSEISIIKSDIEARSRDAQAAAMAELWTRLHDAVQHMVARLSDDKAIFRDSLVGNIEELVVLLPKLNVTEDADLENMRRDVEKKLLGYKSDKLRTDPNSRKQAAKAAKAILDNMSGYMGGDK